MKTSRALIAALALIAGSCAAAAAEVALPPFYQGLAGMSADQPLGTVVAKEAVATEIPGAEAWRIAYVSSDVRNRKTLSTALVIAPKGAAPAGGRPIVAWAHGTTGTAQNCGPSQVYDPAQDLNEYNLIGGTSWTDFGVPAATSSSTTAMCWWPPTIRASAAAACTNMRSPPRRGVTSSIRFAPWAAWDCRARQAKGRGLWLVAGGRRRHRRRQPEGLHRASGHGIRRHLLRRLRCHGAAGRGGADPAGRRRRAPAAAENDGRPRQAFSDNVFNFTHYAMTCGRMPQAFPELKLTDIFTEDGAKHAQRGADQEVHASRGRHDLTSPSGTATRAC